MKTDCDHLGNARTFNKGEMMNESKVNEMARKCRIQEAMRRYLEGLEKKQRLAKKRKSGNLFDLVSYEPRAIRRYFMRGLKVNDTWGLCSLIRSMYGNRTGSIAHTNTLKII